MKTVRVMFQNLQSHEHTEFVLRPGMNFILAEDNNVGKSTIFKVLSRLAKAPNINSNKILSLIRNGCSEATAAFRFDDECVVARFTKYDHEAAKVFFEHVHPDGETTRTVFCPKVLLDALGIVVGPNGELINFNDANSVQLISEVSTEADTIITHVMLDPKIENVKSNLYALSREVNSDLKILTGKAETAENLLRDLEYKPEVEDFDDNLEVLEAGCRVADYGLVPISDPVVLPNTAELSIMKSALTLASAIDTLNESEYSPTISQDMTEVNAAYNCVKLFHTCNFDVLRRLPASQDDLDKCGRLYSVASKMLTAVRIAESIDSKGRQLVRTLQKKQAILSEIKSTSQEVECPVKGSVLYTDEKCIPYNP